MLHWLTDHAVIQRMLIATNRQRTRNALPHLRIDLKLSLAAQKHAVWMSRWGFQHSSYTWDECIHSGPTNPEACVRGWMWSPPHRSILMSGQRVGFGYWLERGQTYWVALVD
ncbi:MAG: CAP domain-containing protein [Planctomycetaceae bacterium]